MTKTVMSVATRRACGRAFVVPHLLSTTVSGLLQSILRPRPPRGQVAQRVRKRSPAARPGFVDHAPLQGPQENDTCRAAAKRRATSGQLTTFQMAFTKSARTLRYCR